MVNKTRLIKLTQQLIRINSENPPGDESKISKFVASYLKRLGLKVRIYEFKNKRSNVIAYLNRPGNKRWLLITPHLDTVPAGRSWKYEPFTGEVIKNKLYGLGATDCKCNLACAMEAINSLVEDKAQLSYGLIMAATADEECGSDLGLIPLLNKKILKPDAALVLDSDDFEIIIAQKGLMHVKVKINGKRAHGAYPHLGINAIDLAIKVIKDLKSRKFYYRKNKFLKSPTINVGTIKGGDKVNIVADWCEFELDFRFLPGSRAEDILKALKGILNKHVKVFKIEIQGIQQPYTISKNHPLVVHMMQAIKKFRVKPKLNGSEGATVITFFQHKKIPAISCGFGTSGCAHIADEYVKIRNLYKGALVLEDFLLNYKF